VIGTTVPTSIDRPDDARARLAHAELVLVDLDGCLTFGSQPHAAAARFVEMFAERYVVVSNNSTETPESMAQKLRATGVPVDPDRIMLAGTLMIDELLAETDAPPVALYAAPELTAYAERRGLRLVERHERGGSARVAIARDTTLVYDDLNKALDRLSRGARLTISNPDLTHPGIDQVPVIETGALAGHIPSLHP
jgi:ribonucleotide monophosphatase NagD (HAD superfamily)